MRKPFVLLLFFLFTYISKNGYAQIIGPDTVCLNTPNTWYTPDSSISYAWAFDSVHIHQPLQNCITVISNNSAINVAACEIMKNDNGNWYAFVTNLNNQLVRLDFGTNPNSSPTVVNMGSIAGALTSGITHNITVIRDTTGLWYGFIADGSNIVRLDFGSTLSNSSPSTTIFNLGGIGVSYGMQISVMKYNGYWVGFLGNFGGICRIVRLDFGNAITNTPSTQVLPVNTTVTSPAYFALFKQSGNWYIFTPDINNNELFRYDFGANLQNNNPAMNNLGNIGGALQDPRGISFIENCDSFYAIMLDENDSFYRLDFPGLNITDTPTITSLGSLGLSQSNAYGLQTLAPYWYNDTLFFLTGNFQNYPNGAIYRIKSMVLPTSSLVSYANSSVTYAFSTPGIHTMSVLCNEGEVTNREAYCKEIYVLAGNPAKIADTAMCNKASIILSDTAIMPPCTWSTGDTSSQLSISSTGTYWLKGTGLCALTDTFHVAQGSVPIVNLGNDTSVCGTQPITLASSGSFINPVYLWSTGANSASINVSQPGTYSLTVAQGKCANSDTVNVQFKPLPVVDLGNDTAICQDFSIILRSAQPAGSLYLWNNGSTNDSLSVSSAGEYWLTVSNNNCIASDSIMISEIQKPSIHISDSTVCFEDVVILPPSTDTNCYHCSYLWSDGSEESTLQVTRAGTYYIIVSNICGVVHDTANIKYTPCNIWFPNAFTPNGDNRNDIARVVGNLQGITDFTLAIYNRWGQRVFYTQDKYSGWDGVFNGAPQPIGAFNYMIIYYFRGQKHLLKGTIDLIR